MSRFNRLAPLHDRSTITEPDDCEKLEKMKRAEWLFCASVGASFFLQAMVQASHGVKLDQTLKKGARYARRLAPPTTRALHTHRQHAHKRAAWVAARTDARLGNSDRLFPI